MRSVYHTRITLATIIYGWILFAQMHIAQCEVDVLEQEDEAQHSDPREHGFFHRPMKNMSGPFTRAGLLPPKTTPEPILDD